MLIFKYRRSSCMKQIFLPLITLSLFMGCGLMNNPKEEEKAIHVPQKITIELPKILKSDSNKTEPQKKREDSDKWYK